MFSWAAPFNLSPLLFLLVPIQCANAGMIEKPKASLLSMCLMCSSKLLIRLALLYLSLTTTPEPAAHLLHLAADC
jgi:hypothetical protein